ncbi:MAG: radical SAM protein, partial [Candidatus Omnitrophica bacterium]|nr:radical SAM protein [Candidatus Omnitrophota bacterium]
MMNILTLIPPALSGGNTIRDVLYGCWCRGRRIGGGTIPPLTLLSVASILKKNGHSVRLMDADGEKKTLKDIKNDIKSFDFVILLTSSMSFREDAQVLAGLKKENPRLITSAFGSHPTFLPEACLNTDGIDILVRYEPEFIYRDLADALSKKNDTWKAVKGIAFRDSTGIHINERYPFIENLDELPIPDRSLLNRNLVYFNPLVKRLPYTTSITSRGCPGKCTFCTAPAFTGSKVRHNSADYVLREIEYLLSSGIKEIYYRDETFSFFPQRNKIICETIIAKKMNVSWLCNVRVGTVKKDMLSLMKKAGCHTIKAGVESGVQEILDKSQKNIRLRDTEDLFRWARELGIATHAHVMLGMPGENRDTMKRTADFVISLKPTTVDFGICTPYPGAALFDKLLSEHKDLKDKMEIDWEMLHTSGNLNK